MSSPMSARPRVSVLIPSYNRGPMLERAVRSALTQAYDDFEIVIADDASPDAGTRAAIERLAGEDSRIVALFAPRNRGLAINWNEGVAACRGEYIVDLGDDDLMLPDKLSRQVAYLDTHPNCGMVTHDADVIDESDRVLYRFSERFAPLHGNVHDVLRREWFPRKRPGYLLCTQMARSSFLKSTRYDPRLKYNNEWLFIIECLLATGQTWDYIPEVLGCYRVHGDQLHQSDDYRQSILEETMIATGILAARYPELARGIRDSRDFALMEVCLYDYAPPARRRAFDRLFRVEAGLGRWLLLQFYRQLRGRPKLWSMTRPLRSAVRLLRELREQAP